MDFLQHFIEQLVTAVRAALFPKIEAVVGKVEAVAHKVEAAAHQIEGLRGDIAKLSAKIDKLGSGGGIDPALLTQVTAATMALRTSAGTLKAAVESITP